MVPPGIEKKLRALFSLLDDEDETVAVSAMKELLTLEEYLPSFLARLQDETEPLLRRRCHQLQVVLTMRRRRREFFRKLQNPYVDTLDGLSALHLQWFDNDSLPQLEHIWLEFVGETRKYPLTSLEELAYFMRKCNFLAQPESTLTPEHYCLGTVLEKRIGAASFLLMLLRAVSALRPLTLGRVLGDFVLQDGQGRLLLPLRNWQIVQSRDGAGEFEKWDFRKFLGFASLNLFSAAVNGDSFRYVLTIAQALCGTNSDEVLDLLPYPYCPAEDGEQEERYS